MANAIADSEGFSIAGGGDTWQRLTCSALRTKFPTSPLAAAYLEFVEGKVLPAVAMLEERAKKCSLDQAGKSRLFCK